MPNRLRLATVVAAAIAAFSLVVVLSASESGQRTAIDSMGVAPSPGDGAEDRTVRLDIEIVAERGIPSSAVKAARVVVDRLYRDIGVEIAWADRNMTIPAAEPNINVVWRRISIKSSADKQFPAAFKNMQVLGVSPRGEGVPGRAAYVFYDAVQVKAHRHALPIAALLGYAMAHELGHLLLPRESHGKSGVMRGQWLEPDLRMIRTETLWLDESDRLQIRTALGLAPAGGSR